jgi:hypothetical protein
MVLVRFNLAAVNYKERAVDKKYRSDTKETLYKD